MNKPFLILRKKLNSDNPVDVKNLNKKLLEYDGNPNNPEYEVGLILELSAENKIDKSELYSLLYDFIEFYKKDEIYLQDFANLVIFGVSKGIIDPIDGSRLIASCWSLLGYPRELAEFIGIEGDLKHIESKIHQKNLKSDELENYNDKIDNIKTKLIKTADNYVLQNT